MSSGPASGSPSGQQKSINAFFSVKGVIRSSPQKSSLPSTSTSSKELNGVVEDEDEEDDDDDVSLLAGPLMPQLKEEEEEEEDDDSLLAAVMMPDPEEEEEIDDDSLLAVAMVPERQEEQEVDYLEGMTAEMFGGDEFSQSINDEDVEALPDAHYGLLGSGNHLLQPQGCIDDLPEEVLRQILCHVPAQDLYRNVSLVCHRWKTIVEDTMVRHTTVFLRFTFRRQLGGNAEELCNSIFS